MNKRKTSILILLLIFIFYCNLEIITSYAADVSVSVGVSSSTVNVGDTVTATISVSGSNLSAYTIYVSYNSSVLEYSSGGGSAVVGGGGGGLTLVGAGSGSTSITFKAIASGSSSISTSGSDALSLEYEELSISHGAASVTVSAPTEKPTEANTSSGGNGNGGGNGNSGGNGNNSTTQSTTENTTENTTEDTDTEDESDNCFLANLEITSAELSPAFDKNTLSYSVSISDEADVDDIEIHAAPEDDKAQVLIEGMDNLTPGTDQTVTITVIAENGDTKTYTVKITWTDTNVYIIADGKEYHFAKDYKDLNIPEGFRKATSTHNGSEIIVYTTPNGLIECVYLLDSNERGAWYVYYKETNSVIPLVYTSPAYIQYIILVPGETEEIPKGYTPFTYQLNGSEVTAYHQTEADTIILFYAMNTDSIANWYYYDTVERTFLRYTAPAEAEEEMIATPTDAESPIMKFYHDNEFLIMILAAILAGIMLITIIVLICILARTRKKYKQAVANTTTVGLVEEESISMESIPEKQDETTAADAPANTEETSVEENDPVAEDASTVESTPIVEENATEESTPITEETLAKESAPVIEETPTKESVPDVADMPSENADTTSIAEGAPQDQQPKPAINTIRMWPTKKPKPVPDTNKEDTDASDADDSDTEAPDATVTDSSNADEVTTTEEVEDKSDADADERDSDESDTNE